MKKIFLYLTVLVLIIAGIIGYNYYRKATRVYEYEAVTLYLPHGTSVEGLNDSLVNTVGKEFGEDVTAIWKKLPGDDEVKSGAYRIEPGQKAVDVAKKIKRGAQTPVRVTFNNVRTMNQLAERFAEQMEFDSEQFLSTMDSVFSAEGIKKAEYPAYFLPDTYEAYWDESPEKFLNRLKSYYNKFWDKERLTKAEQLNLSPVQVASLAAIVEEETNKNDERPKVARLYLNRLSTGMKLQADPTVKFAVGDFTIRRITGEHLKVSSPYNTYLHSGLTPGPIRIAAASTLDAVLNAPRHNYIYMCAKEDFSGYHNFAVDYATHKANAQRYHRALQERGIK